jgi:ribosomal protein L23
MEKKEKVKKTTEGKNKKAKVVKVQTKKNYSYRVTEKAAKLTDSNTLVLNILQNKNKTEIKKELESKYKVNILGIRIVNTKPKKVFSRGRWGVKGGGKKAYITLAKGESIVLE